jgi:hypothetical protein
MVRSVAKQRVSNHGAAPSFETALARLLGMRAEVGLGAPPATVHIGAPMR